MASTTSIALILGVALSVPTEKREEKPPVEVVRGLISAIQDLQRAEEGKTLTAAQEAQNKGIIRRAHAVLDFEDLAQRSLGQTWKDLNGRGRKRFVDLLRTLFAEVAYPQSSKFFGGLDVAIEDGGERRKRRVVEALVSHPEEGRIDLEFFLHQTEGGWKIRDLTLDGVSLGLDIRAQMQKIIRDDGYEVLLTRMKKKIADG